MHKAELNKELNKLQAVLDQLSTYIKIELAKKRPSSRKKKL